MVYSMIPGLSSLIAASYQEDLYGVVQKSLPDILTEMLALHNVSTVEPRYKEVGYNKTLL